MTFKKTIGPKGLIIPTAALKLSGMDASEKFELHTLDGALVLLKEQMTAMDLLTAACQLQKLCVQLHLHLAKACGSCGGCEGECPYSNLSSVELPDSIRQQAGIPLNAKLCMDVDEENQCVTIYEADCRYDLQDVPPEVLEMFAEAGICLGELEEHLMEEDIVYGGE